MTYLESIAAVQAAQEAYDNDSSLLEALFAAKAAHRAAFGGLSRFGGVWV